MKTTEKSAPSRSNPQSPHGGFRPDGSWDNNANHHGKPLDWLSERVDALCASRRRHDRRYTPADFARRIRSRYRKLIGNLFSPATISLWESRDDFTAWECVQTETIAERAIRDGGLGLHVNFIDGRPVDRRTMIADHAQSDDLEAWSCDPPQRVGGESGGW